jgi:hypothetical protein
MPPGPPPGQRLHTHRTMPLITDGLLPNHVTTLSCTCSLGPASLIHRYETSASVHLGTRLDGERTASTRQLTLGPIRPNSSGGSPLVTCEGRWSFPPDRVVLSKRNVVIGFRLVRPRIAEDVNIHAYECDEKRPPEEHLARLTGVLREERISGLR